MNQKKLGILVLAGCLVGIPAMFLGIAHLVVDKSSDVLTVTLHPGDDWRYVVSEPIESVETSIDFGFEVQGQSLYCYAATPDAIGTYFITIAHASSTEDIIIEVVEPEYVTTTLLAAVVMVIAVALAVLYVWGKPKSEEVDEDE